MTCYGALEVAGAVVLAVLPGAAIGEIGRRALAKRVGVRSEGGS